MPSRDPVLALGIEGPVQLEVFVLWLDGDRITLTGPCGAAPWHIETGAGEHPLDVVRRVVTDVVGEPRLVHSTSWRQGPGGTGRRLHRPGPRARRPPPGLAGG